MTDLPNCIPQDIYKPDEVFTLECPNCGETYHEDEFIHIDGFYQCKNCTDISTNQQDYK